PKTCPPHVSHGARAPQHRFLHPCGIKDTACRLTRGDGWAMPVSIGPAAPISLPVLGGVYGLGGQGHHRVADAYYDLVRSRLEQCHRPRDAILLRAAAHAVGALIALHPAQRRGMLGMAMLP